MFPLFNMMKNTFYLFILMLMVGCSSNPKQDVQYVEDGYVLAAKTDFVEIHALQRPKFEIKRNEHIDIWELRIVNNDIEHDWCASVEWRQMDYDIQVPNQWFYLPAAVRVNIGHAVQQTWNFDEVFFTMDDAAFTVFRLNLRKPHQGQCVVKAK